MTDVQHFAKAATEAAAAKRQAIADQPKPKSTRFAPKGTTHGH